MLILKAPLLELIEYLLQNQRFNLVKNCDFNQFRSKMAKKSISQGILKTDLRVNNQPILGLKVSKEAH